MQAAFVGNTLEKFHRFSAAHKGVASSHFDKLRESVIHVDLNLMT